MDAFIIMTGEVGVESMGLTYKDLGTLVVEYRFPWGKRHGQPEARRR